MTSDEYKAAKLALGLSHSKMDEALGYASKGRHSRKMQSGKAIVTRWTAQRLADLIAQHGAKKNQK
jgi:hypothetical protein